MQLDQEFLNTVTDALVSTWGQVHREHVLGYDAAEIDAMDAEEKADMNGAAIEYSFESGVFEHEFEDVRKLIDEAYDEHGFEVVDKFINENVHLDISLND
jgi:hypothetical protein